MNASVAIDAYLATVAPPQRAALVRVRKVIMRRLPGIEECISYGMPAFRYQGTCIAGFMATKTGCSYYPFSGTTLATLAIHLHGYSQTKAALHFTTNAPLPVSLIHRLLAARVAELPSIRQKGNAMRANKQLPRARRAEGSARTKGTRRKAVAAPTR